MRMATAMAFVPMGANGIKRPSIFDTLGEFRVPYEAAVSWLSTFNYPWHHVDRADSKVVMLIPGFMAGDATLIPLAHFLRLLGHRTVFSGITSNSRCPRDTLNDLSKRLTRAHERFGQRIVLIGQSLGGVYARALARENPDLVERVITLGAPIRQPHDSANYAVASIAKSVAVLRGKANGCLSENCQCGLRITDEAPVNVPITVIYSRTDGVVHWQACIDRSGLKNVENVEILGSHCGMAVNVEAFRIIADRLEMQRRREPSHHARS
jgi:triacylglycerol lipase